jgi:F0F1-type ATP synthase assembly protein I
MVQPGNVPEPPPRPRYTWPWFVLAFVLLGIALAVLWMSKAVERTRRERQWNAQGTTAPSSSLPPR